MPGQNHNKMTPLFCGRRSAFALALIAALLAVGAQAQPASQLAAASSTKVGLEHRVEAAKGGLRTQKGNAGAVIILGAC